MACHRHGCFDEIPLTSSAASPYASPCASCESLLGVHAQAQEAVRRSLIAAYEIGRLKITDGDIKVLKGGFSEWKRNSR